MYQFDMLVFGGIGSLWHEISELILGGAGCWCGSPLQQQHLFASAASRVLARKLTVPGQLMHH